MSDGLNKVLLMGNLGSTPELRRTEAGTAVLHFSLATNESYMGKDKKLVERTDWHNIVVWGPRAEGLAKVLDKGSSVLVEGCIRTSVYEKNDTKHYRTEISAQDIKFTGRRANNPQQTDSKFGKKVIVSLQKNKSNFRKMAA